MSEVVFHHVKEGQFFILAKTRSMTKLYAQECEKTPNRFSLVGIDQLKGIAYAVRHGRTNELRTWRLDILINRVRKMGLSNVEVQLLHPADDA